MLKPHEKKKIKNYEIKLNDIEKKLIIISISWSKKSQLIGCV
jgi:hypothetical protein